MNCKLNWTSWLLYSFLMLKGFAHSPSLQLRWGIVFCWRCPSPLLTRSVTARARSRRLSACFRTCARRECRWSRKNRSALLRRKINRWDRARSRGAQVLERHRSATRRPIGKMSAKCCSFSAVSAPIFASKYAFWRFFQNLPDYQAENFEIW